MPRHRVRLGLLFLLALCVLVPLRHAYAAGTVQIVSREPAEEDGKWKLKFTIGLGTPPPIAHVPMLFKFQATVLYERSLTDKGGDKPIVTRLPLQNQQPINESLDVDFSDGGSKIYPTTKFDFVIRRDRGFEAGEYDLKITREADGVPIGQTIKLILKGDNPVVDRRAMVFSGDQKKKVEADKPAEKVGDTTAPATPPGGDAPPDEAAPTPPAVEPKQGGCGCRTAGEEDTSNEALAALALLAGAVIIRRRRPEARI